MAGPYRKLFFTILALFAALLGMDRLFYGWLIFVPANSIGWDSHRWYNFEYQFRYLEKKEKKRPLVLIVGSSIAQYSVQRHILEPLLKKTGAEVEMLAHAAMVPVDLRNYAERIRGLHPDLVVYITNPADFDLERYVPPWEAGPEYSEMAAEDYLQIRYPVNLFYPAKFAMEDRFISMDKRASLAARGLFYSLRFKDDWREPVEFSFRNGPLRSYLNYQGIEIPEGIFREGYTGGCFRFPSSALIDGVFLFEVPAVLSREKEFSVRVFRVTGSSSANPFRQYLWNGQADMVRPEFVSALEKAAADPVSLDGSRLCSVPGGAKFVHEFKTSQAGWSKLALLPYESEDYFVELSHVSNGEKALRMPAGGAVYTGRGLRLPGNFGLKEKRERDYYVRRRFLEDSRYSRMTAAEYIRDYDERIQPSDWREEKHIAHRQLNQVRISKYLLNLYDFRITRQFRELEATLSQFDAPLLIINNPENPVSFEEYSGSRWYRGYIDYMNGLPAKSDRVHFLDLGGRLKENDFIDPHHLTFDGLLRMAPVYAREIESVLQRN